MHLGAHMSIAGGVHRALERGAAAGCQSVQIFTRNQLRWRSRPLDPSAAARFRQLSAGFCAILAHASYLINLASPYPTQRRRSVAALAEELRRCESLGIQALVMHPGAHDGAGKIAGTASLRAGAREAFEAAETPPVRLLLETTAGRGTALGGSFAELRDLLGEVSRAGVPCGVCFDTCHVFAAGYDLRDPEGYADTWRRFDALIGQSQLGAIHLNDSRGAVRSRLDRHAHIGEGQIGTAAFTLLVNDPRLAEVPGVLETPKGPGLKEDMENLALLRRLIGSPEPAPCGFAWAARRKGAAPAETPNAPGSSAAWGPGA